MIVRPVAHAQHTFHYAENVSVVLTDVSTSEVFVVQGNSIRTFLGKKGITVQGYDTRTGRFTQTVRHLNVETTKFLGIMQKGIMISGDAYVQGYGSVADVFRQNV